MNPFIGTENSNRPSIWEANGGTYPGAVLPFGMVQVTPEDYHYNTHYIKSFSLVDHTSGYPKGSSGNFQIMPFNGEFYKVKSIGSSFQHKNEIATPGYYSVFLDEYSIKAEMTATEYAAFFKFSFPENDTSVILIHGIDEAQFDLIGNLVGKCRGYYFVLKLNDNNPDISIEGTTVLIRFKDYSSKEVLVKIGFSLTSTEDANKNLDGDIPAWNFERVKLNANKKWNAQLKRILVEGNNETDKEIFYTALYHTYLAPCIISDRGELKRYSGLSPWDTYKCKQPLITMLDKSIQANMIQSVLEQYERDGLMNPGPMTGVHNVPVIVDSYIKGVEGFEIDKAYEAMQTSLLKPPFGRRDIKSFIEHNYVPAEKSYSVTKTLEYSYDFWAMGQVALELNDTSQYDLLIERSRYFKNIYNPDTKFMTAKNSVGDWERGGYREGDKWAYNWTCTHDIQGLINLAGGKSEFAKQLDTCFQTGKYFHDNEPPLHNAYLYCYAGQPWKTQEIVNDILQLDYSAKPGGISGNDDLGALSAWYVFSSMGFFPVCPGRPEYVIGSPIFDKVTIFPEGGNPFVIHSKKVSKKDKYIQSVSLNGEDYKNLWISHLDIISGGLLEFTMGARPNSREIENEYLPLSETKSEPEFSIEKWGMSKNSGGADEPIEIWATIQNRGKSTSSVSLNVFVNDILKETKWFIIDSGLTETKTLSVKLYVPGNYKISLNGKTPQNIKILAEKKATFSYSSLNLPSPPLSKIDVPVTFKTKIKNIGSFTGTENVKLFKDNRTIDNQLIKLKPGEEKEVLFKTTFHKEGLYEIKIGNTADERLLVFGPEFSEKPVYNKNVKPIMAFDFNEVGAKSIKDYSGLKNDAIAKGDVEWIDGIFGKAIKTNAHKEAYIEVPDHTGYNSIANGKIMTMMLWIYPLDEKNFADIISKGDLNVIQVRASNTEVNYYSGGYQRGEAYSLVPENWNRQWHHLAGVSDRKELKLYIDGKLMVIKELENQIDFTGTTDKPWNIGRNASNTDRVFDGYIDQLMIFDKALDHEEIKEFMLFIGD